MKKNNKGLIIIDLQNDFFIGPLEEHAEWLIKNTNELVAACRKQNIPIFWVRQIWSEDGHDHQLAALLNNRRLAIRGTKGAELLPDLDYRESDYEIIKTQFSAFFETEFDALLKDLGINTLIIAGINTMTCVRTTAIDAYMRKYKIFLATDYAFGYDKIQHEASLHYLSWSIVDFVSNEIMIAENGIHNLTHRYDSII